MISDVEKMLREYYEAMSAPHDLERLEACLADDCVHEDVGAGDAWEGKETLMAYFEAFFRDAPDFTVEVGEIIVGADGDWVATEGVMSGTETVAYGGRTRRGSYRLRMVDIVELKDGKIRRESTYYDNHEFLRQMGLLAEEPVD